MKTAPAEKYPEASLGPGLPTRQLVLQGEDDGPQMPRHSPESRLLHCTLLPVGKLCPWRSQNTVWSQTRCFSSSTGVYRLIRSAHTQPSLAPAFPLLRIPLS